MLKRIIFSVLIQLTVFTVFLSFSKRNTGSDYFTFLYKQLKLLGGQIKVICAFKIKLNMIYQIALNEIEVSVTLKGVSVIL